LLNPWVIGHRGASGHAPENTMAAFRRAVEQGARFIETDLQATRDGRLVALHDATLERTTNGSGFVAERTLDEILRLDAGAWYGAEYAGERVPTLEQMLHFAREQDIGFFLEIKQEAAWGIEHGLVSAIRNSGEAHRIVVLSFSPGILRNFHRLDRTLVTGLLSDDPRLSPAALVEQAAEIGARQVAPRGDLLSRDLLERARRNDLQVVTWTVNDPEQMRALQAVGVDGIMTDYPDRLVRVLSASPA
jgi:glycerophosphoryl diester phosphodiesterase